MAFHQRRDVTVLRAAQQIAFPMTRNRSVFRFRRSFADRDGIDDLTARLSADGCVSRAAHASLRPQVVHQLFFQYATRLNEQAGSKGEQGDRRNVSGLRHCTMAWDTSEETFRLSPRLPNTTLSVG
jgi:hypothetical protein